jgi:DNA-binding IclR family transcriptional regulator
MGDKSQSLDRGIAILELIGQTRDGLGVREIGRRLSLSPTIVQRLINSMLQVQFLKKHPETQKYSLGYRALTLGSSVLSSDNLIASAMPVLSRLTAELRVNAYLAVISGERLVYVLSLQSDAPISIRALPGTTASFHSTAMGKAMLASEPEDRVKALLQANPLVAVTRKTITNRRALFTQLEEIRRTGYATSIEENLPGVVAVGVSIRNAAGRTIAAVSTGFAPQLQADVKLPHVIRKTLVAANEISRNLGCPPDLLKNVAARGTDS